MKKLVTLLLALALMLGCTALAEEEAKPILFRGIPWGSSYTEVAEQLELDEFTPEFYLYATGIAYLLYGGESISPPIHGPNYGYAHTKVSEVAGYPVSGCTLAFARVPGEDGLLTEDVADTALIYACYGIKPDANSEAVAKDLTNKLTGLYGEPDLSHEGYAVWHGAEGTLASFQLRNDEDILIRYGFEGGDDLLLAAEALYGLASPDNVDGL